MLSTVQVFSSNKQLLHAVSIRYAGRYSRPRHLNFVLLQLAASWMYEIGRLG